MQHLLVTININPQAATHLSSDYKLASPGLYLREAEADYTRDVGTSSVPLTLTACPPLASLVLSICLGFWTSLRFILDSKFEP